MSKRAATIEIVNIITGEVVDGTTEWEYAYSKRDELQSASLAAGQDLTQCRYGVRSINS